jgi:hypothetical protein
VAGSCTSVEPPQDLIACNPGVPSSLRPVSSTPIARGPSSTAAERIVGSMAGRA